MNTSGCKNTLPKKAYYRLLASSYQRAKHLLANTKQDPRRQQETLAYLKQLQKEMKRFDDGDKHPVSQKSREVEVTL